MSGLAKRIRSELQGEVTTLQRQQLQPAITAEQQAEGIRSNLAGQAARIAGRIECLNWLIREYPRIRVNMDQTAAQQIAALRGELAQLNQQLSNVDHKLNQATTALNNARERRLAAERIVASKEGTNMQQFTDLRYLYDMSRLNPPRFTWDAMMERITAVAREKQLDVERYDLHWSRPCYRPIPTCQWRSSVLCSELYEVCCPDTRWKLQFLGGDGRVHRPSAQAVLNIQRLTVNPAHPA